MIKHCVLCRSKEWKQHTFDWSVLKVQYKLICCVLLCTWFVYSKCHCFITTSRLYWVCKLCWCFGYLQAVKTFWQKQWHTFMCTYKHTNTCMYTSKQRKLHGLYVCKECICWSTKKYKGNNTSEQFLERYTAIPGIHRLSKIHLLNLPHRPISVFSLLIIRVFSVTLTQNLTRLLQLSMEKQTHLSATNKKQKDILVS